MRARLSETLLSFLFIVLILGAYLYLFAWADRKIFFLYEHLGAKPFDPFTVGRYWMAGFIISGFISILYFSIKLVFVFIKTGINIFGWKSVISIAAAPLLLGIILITMFLGEPRMPFSIAVSTATALILGLTLGTSVVDDFFDNQKDTLTYIMAGIGLVPFVTLFRALELPKKGILNPNFALGVAIASAIAGFFWLIIALRVFRRAKISMVRITKGILTMSYLGLPVLHFIVATPRGIPYITTSDNFFANSYALRLFTWGILIAIIISVFWINRKIGSSKTD
jgi:hypothetical protein